MNIKCIAVALAYISYTGIFFTTDAQAMLHETLDKCTNVPRTAVAEFPKNQFDKCAAPMTEVRSGGPPRDGIPSIDEPRFASLINSRKFSPNEPMILVKYNNVVKVYPLSILTWHEIVNDRIGNRHISVTFCPLCNASVVFDRQFNGKILEFGTTGRLRKSDLIMYDRTSETWWQQYTGRGIVGEYAGQSLSIFPSRVVSFADVQSKYPRAKILQPPSPALRQYGTNPYVGYDTSRFPFLFDGEIPDGIKPLERVVVVGDSAWPFRLLQQRKQFISEGLRITWRPGLASALDSRSIANGRDVGSVLVEKQDSSGRWQQTQYKVTFAFVFYAFQPDGTLHRPQG